MLLVDTHSPTSEAELAVHKKKILAVKTWLQQPFSKILILSGPSGSGKTAVIKTLSKSLGFEILEWESPNNDTALQTKFDECKTYTPLIDTFIEFLYSCGNRSALPFSSTIPRKQIILVEDVPLIGHSSSRNKFHTAIRNYCTFTRNTTPIVFILSDILCSDEKYESITSVRTLFPPELLLDNRIHQIMYNILFYLVYFLDSIQSHQPSYTKHYQESWKKNPAISFEYLLNWIFNGLASLVLVIFDVR